MGRGLSELQRELLRLAATAPPIEQPSYKKAKADEGIAFDVEAFLTHYGRELVDADYMSPERYERKTDVERRQKLRYYVLYGMKPFGTEIPRAHRVAVTRALARLVERGLIERFWYVSHHSSRRKGLRSAFSLTDEGRQAFASIKANVNR